MDVTALEPEGRTADLMPRPILAGKPVIDPVVYLDRLWRDLAGLKAALMRLTRDPELTADILQDAAVTALEKLESGEIANPEGIGGYVYRVAINHLRNHRRKDRSSKYDNEFLEQLKDENADALGVDLDRAVWAAEIRAVLESMPTVRDREIIVRFYLRGEDKSDICAALNLSEEHFNRVIFRARERFRLGLERRGTLKRSDVIAVLLSASVALLAATLAVAGPFAGVLL